MSLHRHALSAPDDVREFPNGRLELYGLGEGRVGRTVYEPGWRWSTDVKPAVRTDWCQLHHRGITISGRLRIEASDGTSMEIGPDDLFEVPAGHDAWVVGDEPWVAIDFFG